MSFSTQSDPERKSRIQICCNAQQPGPDARSVCVLLSAEPREGDVEMISAKGDCDDIGDDLERQDDAWNAGK